VLRRDITFESVALTTISTWEATALLSGRLPTVTNLTMRLPRPVRALLVAGVAVWMLEHFDVR
jgi:hypothetical protein